MKPYMFVFNAIPTSSNKECKDIAGGRVHIWVMEENLETAKIRALTDIASYHWKVTGVEYESEILPEQFSHLHESEALLYHKALQNGIAADYLASPVKQGSPDDPVVIRKLDRP